MRFKLSGKGEVLQGALVDNAEIDGTQKDAASIVCSFCNIFGDASENLFQKISTDDHRFVSLSESSKRALKFCVKLHLSGNDVSSQFDLVTGVCEDTFRQLIRETRSGIRELKDGRTVSSSVQVLLIIESF